MVMDLLQAPIPGQSLTSPPGASPFENPPQHTDIETALEEIWNKLTQPKQVIRLCIILKKGMPAEYLAKTILFEGFSKGKWTPDMAFLMLKIVMSMIIAIAVTKNIKPKIFSPDKDQEDFLDQFVDDPELTAEEPITQDTIQDLPKQFTGLLGAKL